MYTDDCDGVAICFPVVQRLLNNLWQQVANINEYTKYFLFSLMLFAILFYVNQNPQKFFKEDW